MRVISGIYGGRRLAAPAGAKTRPTADRVREATFSRITALGFDFDGKSVFDAYAGSGALGIEALSRGCNHATFVDDSRRACDTVRANLNALGAVGKATVVCADVRKVTARALPAEPFSLLFLDPPYRIRKSEVRGLVERLVSRDALAPGALVVWEHDSAREPDWPQTFEDLGSRQYGSTQVSIARLVKHMEG